MSLYRKYEALSYYHPKTYYRNLNFWNLLVCHSSWSRCIFLWRIRDKYEKYYDYNSKLNRYISLYTKFEERWTETIYKFVNKRNVIVMISYHTTIISRLSRHQIRKRLYLTIQSRISFSSNLPNQYTYVI